MEGVFLEVVARGGGLWIVKFAPWSYSGLCMKEP